MPDAQPYIARRPKRADGARNYDAILSAAGKAFESQGADASLEDIAGQAGVAIGTLYRHFPTRASLVEAATREGLAELIGRAEELSGAPDPWPPWPSGCGGPYGTSARSGDWSAS